MKTNLKIEKYNQPITEISITQKGLIQDLTLLWGIPEEMVRKILWEAILNPSFRKGRSKNQWVAGLISEHELEKVIKIKIQEDLF